MCIRARAKGTQKPRNPTHRYIAYSRGKARPYDRGNTPPGISPPSRYGKTATPLAAEAPAPVVPEGIDGAVDKGAEEMTQHWDLVFVTSGTALDPSSPGAYSTVPSPPPPRKPSTPLPPGGDTSPFVPEGIDEAGCRAVATSTFSLP